MENLEAIHAAGATPYIPFKGNATGGSGGLWGKIEVTGAVLRTTGLPIRHCQFGKEDSMSDTEERREQEDVEGHRRYKEEPPTEDELARRRRVAEGETSDDSDDDVELHRR